jgi:hypothetical protein
MVEGITLVANDQKLMGYPGPIQKCELPVAPCGADLCSLNN